MEDLAHSQFDLLAGDRVGDVGNGDDFRGNMPWRGVEADRFPDPLAQVVRELGTGAELDEEHDAHVVLPLLADGQAVEHFVDGLHPAIDLGGAHADAAGVERRVGSAGDDHAAVLRDLREVAVMPDAGEALEICGADLLPVRIVPKGNRHGDERGGADELALRSANRIPGVVEHLDGHAEASTLELSRVNRQVRVAPGEAGDDVRPSRDRREADVLLDISVDVFEALLRERRPGGADRAERRQVELLPGFHAFLRQGLQVLCAGPEDGHGLIASEAPQHGGIGMKRVPVVEEEGGAGGEAADEPVPHHPAAGREVENSRIAGDVRVEPELFDVLEERSARAVDDALGHAGGPGGIENVDRMIEGERLEFDLGGVRKEISVENRAGNGGEVRLVGRVGDDHDLLDGREFPENSGDSLQGTELFALEEIAVSGEKDARLNLCETIEDPLDSEVGGTGGPDRAETHGGEHGGYGLGQIGKEGGDPVSLPDAHCSKRGAEARDVGVKLAIRE